MDGNFDLIEKNISAIFEKMAPYPEAHLMAAIKTRGDAEIRKAYECGVRYFGENRVQELLAHYECVRSLAGAKLHMIGTLQKNKVKYIIDKVDMIESLDSVGLAEEINKRAEKQGIRMPVLIEINSAEEEAKSGVMPSEAERLLNEILPLPAIRTVGIMTMGPVCERPEDIRPYFRLTKKIFDDLHTRYGFGDSPTLSMGMTDSYRIAIEEGSTLVRVGRRLFIK